MCSVTEMGRREQKKAATRQALQQAALRLFEENGYLETTVKDIAAVAGVTERTFFRYFPSKEDMIFSELFDLLPLWQEQIRSRPAGEDPLTAVLNALLAVAAKRDFVAALLFSGPPGRLIQRASRRSALRLVDFEDGIAGALAIRLAASGVPESPPGHRELRASVLARAAVSAVRSALIAHADIEESPASSEAIISLLHETFAILRGEA